MLIRVLQNCRKKCFIVFVIVVVPATRQVLMKVLLDVVVMGALFDYWGEGG
jgi:hypothetical protein